MGGWRLRDITSTPYVENAGPKVEKFTSTLGPIEDEIVKLAERAKARHLKWEVAARGYFDIVNKEEFEKYKGEEELNVEIGKWWWEITKEKMEVTKYDKFGWEIVRRCKTEKEIGRAWGKMTKMVVKTKIVNVAYR